ncbi:oxygenase MpaB family protein [Streptomyces sp. A012304]|uniref:oxygenase MpaB family protein n=1 Tax=Streptomyces sp. A012304 TaxID=375446 RepID=UPI00222FBA83|nr:oxygenase MpaB family protein [Streptomyces sp. A012304]
MTAHPPPRKAGERMGAPEAASRPDSRTDRLVTLFTAGDPLADAVVAELDHYGPPARRALDAGLRNGLASLDAKPPAAVAALLRHLETPPPWVDPLMLHRGDLTSLSVAPMWFQLCSVTVALAHTYASPATARQLVAEGRPADLAARRLTEAGVWARQTVRPGGLLRGRPGYLATVEVRLHHARMRARAVEEWDLGATGLPIGRLDMARTWLGFTFEAFRALEALGIGTGPDEERHLYRYWAYVAHLLGLGESLHQDVHDHAGAHRLRDLMEHVTPAPDENTRVLITALVDAQSRATAGAPGADLSEEQVRHLLHSVLRRAFGPQWGDRVGIPEVPSATDLLPLISRLNREARYWQTYSPASAQEARRRALAGPGPDPTAAVEPCGSACRRIAEGARPAVLAGAA